MCYKNDKNIKFVISRFVFSSSKCTNPAGGAYDAPPDPVVGWGTPSPFPFPARRLRRIELGAYGASVLRPPQHKILDTPLSTYHFGTLHCQLRYNATSVH